MSLRYGIPRTHTVRSWLLGLAAFLLVTAVPVTVHAFNTCGGKQCFAPDLAVSSPINPSAPGDFIDCESSVYNCDESGAINRVLEGAQDDMSEDIAFLDCTENPVDLDVRIVRVVGNAACTNDGAACVAATGANCRPPCITCQPGDTRMDTLTGLTCPNPPPPEGLEVGEIQYRHSNVCEITSCPPPEPSGPDAGLSKIDDFSSLDIRSVCAGDPSGPACPAEEPGEVGNGGTTFCESGCPEPEIVKTCVDSTNDECNCQANYEVTVTNIPTGDNVGAPATGCLVEDTRDATTNPLACERADGTPIPAGPFDLAVGETVTCDFLECLDPENSATDQVTVTCTEVPECPFTDSDTAECKCIGVDNYKCYNMKLENRARFPRQDVTLEDQFGVKTVNVIAPFEICNPVDKNGEGIEDPEAHLMCYKLFSRDRNRQYVIDEDQFGAEELLVGGAIELCVPALKDCVEDPDATPPVTCNLEELEARLNHYECYRARTARGADPLTPDPVNLVDQFETKDTDLLRTSLHCNPAAKNGAFPDDVPAPNDPDDPSAPGVHLKCYDIQDSAGQVPHRGASVKVVDQFADGEWDVLAGRPTRLCEPARKELQ